MKRDVSYDENVNYDNLGSSIPMMMQKDMFSTLAYLRW